MQRKRTANNPVANAVERRYMGMIKERPCCACGAEGPSIVEHMYGSTFKHNKQAIGHWALLPYCYDCDNVKTTHGRAAHNERFGSTQAELWAAETEKFGDDVPIEVQMAIEDWGR